MLFIPVKLFLALALFLLQLKESEVFFLKHPSLSYTGEECSVPQKEYRNDSIEMAFDSRGFCCSVSSEDEDNSDFYGIGKMMADSN